jgi:hypothetical protein
MKRLTCPRGFEMRMMMIALAAVLFAAPLSAPLSAQVPERATPSDAWMRMPVPDARLRVELAAAPVGKSHTAHWGPRSTVQWMLIGAAVGCVGGALVMASGADEGEKSVAGFNGCILGGSAGIFLAGLYGLATGAD